MLKPFRLCLLPLALGGLSLVQRFALADESVSGSWKMTIQAGQDSKEYNLVLKQDGSKVSGELISPRSGRKDPFDGGAIDGAKLRFEVKRQGGEVFGCEAERKSASKFEGKILVNGQGPANLVLTKEQPAAVAGKWSVISKTPDGQEYPSKLELTEEGGKLKGNSISSLGTIPLEEIAFDGAKLDFQLTLPIDGNKVPFRISADVKDANKLAGRWKTRDADFTGEWTATREVAAAAAPEAKPAPPPTPAANPALSGKWQGIVETPQGKKNVTLELKAEADKLTGKIHTTKGPADVQNGKASGNKIEFSFPYKADDGEVTIKVEAELMGDVLKGRWSVPSGEGGELRARKPVTL